MKKVCVVTWSGGENYGTNLQAYALVKKLQLLGYDAKLKGNIKGNVNYLRHPAILLDRIYIRAKRRVHSKSTTEEKYNQRKEKFINFCNKYLPKLNSYGRTEWETIKNEYVAFITGSDQVWNPNYFQGAMMLDFITDNSIKKIAYAPSIGVEKLPWIVRKKYKSLLSSYSAIGMREKLGAELIRDLCSIPVKTVLDPTLLLSATIWDNLIEDVDGEMATCKKEPYVLCYFVGKRDIYKDYLDLIKKRTGYKCLIIPMEVDLSLCGETLKGVGPKEFIWLIKNAELICTDSFHATVFSIIYQKEFYVLKRFEDSSKASQNSRLYDILDTYGLSYRCVQDENVFERQEEINYVAVQRILDNNIKKSEKFLIDALEGR